MTDEKKKIHDQSGGTKEGRSAGKKGSQTVFYVSAAISVLIVLVGALNSSLFGKLASMLLNFIEEQFSWIYLLFMLVFVVFCIGMAFSRFGNIRLGPDDSKPQYSTVSWFAMLFCAGMGVGLVFWGISEPLSHYVSPAAGIEPGSPEAAQFAIRSCFMHWGIHPWAAYAVVGLGLAYFQFRKNKPGLISSLFIPMLGEKGVKGPIGKAIDIFAVIVSVAGVATSLGMGCLQICGGLNYLCKIPNNAMVWLLVIVIICCIYLLSATSGLDKGIKMLSNFNLCLAVVLLIISFLAGPSVKILEIFTTGIGDYITHFVSDSLGLSPFGDNSWVLVWRVFYWAWWIAWAPFVGIFIARISRGRTIKEFIIGVIVVPCIASIIWFSVFGGVALNAADAFSLEELGQIAAVPETALFIILNEYPIGKILSVIAIVLLVIFFITSADSATFVLSMLTSEGNIDPPNRKKIVWGVLQAAIAYVLLLSGGVKALQTASIAAAFPFAIIMLLVCINIVKGLKEEVPKKEEADKS
ncbi:MAG: BCCT family transporter [Lachnospiraceae bacterium]|nr:BCCT family transporter [Lachnospiraceae bacterium]